MTGHDKVATASQFLRFAAVGAVGTLAQYAVLWLGADGLGWPATWASAAGYLLGSVVNYLLNYRYTFASNKSHLEAASKFYVIAAGGWLINTGLMALFTAQSSLKPQLDAAVGAFGRDGRREATTRQAHACKEERQSRAPDQTCQRPRSALTRWGSHLEGTKTRVHAACLRWISGQLRFQGLFWHHWPAQLLTTGTCLLWNFAGSKLWAFRHPPESGHR